MKEGGERVIKKVGICSYFNYFLVGYYRVKLFLSMQVKAMAACL